MFGFRAKWVFFPWSNSESVVFGKGTHIDFESKLLLDIFQPLYFYKNPDTQIVTPQPQHILVPRLGYRWIRVKQNFNKTNNRPKNSKKFRAVMIFCLARYR